MERAQLKFFNVVSDLLRCSVQSKKWWLYWGVGTFVNFQAIGNVQLCHPLGLVWMLNPSILWPSHSTGNKPVGDLP